MIQMIRRLIVGVSFTAALISCAPVVVAPGPDMSNPSLLNDSFITADGARLPLRLWQPQEEPKAIVIALHGFNDYSNFFSAPGTFLAQEGIIAYAFDQRGFGASPHHGIWPGLGAYIKDVKSFIKEVKRHNPAIPLYLLGESMGGAVVMAAMARDDAPDVNGVIVAAPAVWGRETMPFYQNWALWIGAHTVPWFELTGQGLKIKASDNIEMLRALGRDPLVIKSTRIDTIYGLVNLMDKALASSSYFNVRSLILYGENDEVIPKKPFYLMLRRLPKQISDKLTVAIYKNGYHMLLRDLQAEVVWRDIAAWIGDRRSPLPSGADKRAKIILAKAIAD